MDGHSSSGAAKTLTRDRECILKTLTTLLAKFVFLKGVSSEKEERELMDCNIFQEDINTTSETNIISVNFLI
jgi:hypothetical protein